MAAAQTLDSFFCDFIQHSINCTW